MKSQREEGFTLIEILVVVLIIGILAAIAVPVFLNQRQRSINASLESDIKQMIIVQNDYMTSNRSNYGQPMAIRESDTTNTLGSHNSANLPFNPSPGNYIRVPGVSQGNDKGFCIIVWNANSNKYKTEQTGLSYSSLEGKIREGACTNV